MFINELILTFGAGMTVKFFPVFFKEEGHIQPILLQAVFASLYFLAGIGTLVANRLSKKFGRLQVIICGYCIGISCTMLLGLLRPYYTVPAVMLPIFLTRCTCQWSCTPLLGSIIADYTPKATRGRWKALSSISVAGWSGSAAVGGWLIDQTGFGSTFVITGCIQAFSIPTLCLLLPLVAKESELTSDNGRALIDSEVNRLDPASPGECFEPSSGGEVRRQLVSSPGETKLEHAGEGSASEGEVRHGPTASSGEVSDGELEAKEDSDACSSGEVDSLT
eukprot:symbB.v1.2.013521.t1/scaffold795.1/size259473/13